MRCAERALLSFGIAVLAYEIVAPPGELLSHAVARIHDAHPWLTPAVVIVTAAHLLEWIPPAVDPFHLVGIALNGRES